MRAVLRWTAGDLRAHRGQAVDRQAEVPLEPADAAAERESRTPRVAHDAHGDDQRVRLGGHVELAQERAAVHAGDPALRVHLDPAHRREVDDEPAVPASDAHLAVAAGASPVEAAILSNHAAGIVVGKVGTATASANELLESFNHQ